jgi:hypothetical protein
MFVLYLIYFYQLHNEESIAMAIHWPNSPMLVALTFDVEKICFFSYTHTVCNRNVNVSE